jgi:MYXO-CTERM domain-containing protein
VICPAGDVCQNGSCISACTGAVCPGSQVCKTGACVAGAASDDAGGGIVLVEPDGGFTSSDGGFIGSGSGSGGGSVDDGGTGTSPAPKAGCGCRTTTPGERGGVAIGAALGVLAVLVRRRRRT